MPRQNLGHERDSVASRLLRRRTHSRRYAVVALWANDFLDPHITRDYVTSPSIVESHRDNQTL